MHAASKSTAAEGGLTAVVGAIIAYLPSRRVQAPSGRWHQAFMELRDRYSDELPELRGLEFTRRAGVPPVSERLENILQVLDIGGTSSTLNPTLVVRQFDATQKARLKKGLGPLVKNREPVVRRLGKELGVLLKNG